MKHDHPIARRARVLFRDGHTIHPEAHIKVRPLRRYVLTVREGADLSGEAGQSVTDEDVEIWMTDAQADLARLLLSTWNYAAVKP